jgi:hypothetical protein
MERHDGLVPVASQELEHLDEAVVMLKQTVLVLDVDDVTAFDSGRDVYGEIGIIT